MLTFSSTIKTGADLIWRSYTCFYINETP